MPITLNAGRQEAQFAYVDVAFADLTSGVAQIAVKLPPGSIVLAGSLNVVTAFNSATSDALVVGDATVANRYLASTSLQAAGRTPIVPTGFVTTGNETSVKVTYTGVGAAPTAGALRLEVSYVTKGVAESSRD